MSARPIVLKLGGSHARVSLLRPVLRAIEDAHATIAVVPGGGPLADAVRDAQAELGFDDHAAHDMALMAMAQFGRAIEGMSRRFTLADDVPALRDAWSRGQVPVWSPWPMLDRHPAIPASWDVTSDSLALWLAAEIDADEVVLVKHLDGEASGTPAEWARAGLVDPAFPVFRARFSGSVRIATASRLGLTEPARS